MDKKNKKKLNYNALNHYNIILKFLPNFEIFSFQVPHFWKVKKLIKFIYSTFENDFHGKESYIIYKGKPLDNYNDLTLSQIFNKNTTHKIIINVKEDVSKLKDKISKIHSNEILTNEEFIETEKLIFNDYSKLFPKISFKTFPLMSSSLKRKISIVNKKKQKFNLNELGSLEKFPINNYFKIEIIFKLFVSYIVFSIYMKGWKFPFFISLLLIYYWYDIKTSIEEYYKLKIEEIKLNENDKREIEKIEQEKQKEIKLENINEYINEILKNKNKKNKNKKEQIIKENKNNKKEEIKNKFPETGLNFYIICINEIIFVLFMSLFPFWCDKFEQENPFPEEKKNDVNESEENNINENNDNLNENINQNDLNNEDNKKEEEGSLSQKISDSQKQTYSKIVNISESSDLNHFKILKKEQNDNKTEKEYEFSENGGIDNLSLNENLEYFKQKIENEKEKEKEIINTDN